MNERPIAISLELDPNSEQIRGILCHRGSRRRFIGWLSLASAIEAMRQEQTKEEDHDAQ